MAARALDLTDISGESPYTDCADGYVVELFEKGIMNGTEEADGLRYFYPDRPISRQELSAVVWRMMNVDYHEGMFRFNNYWLDWLEDVEDGCFASAFDGEITTLYPEKAVNPIEECYSDDMIRFIPAARATEMFKMAYASPEELLDEFKENATLSQLGLSEDFDWWGHLVSISGTTFC